MSEDRTTTNEENPPVKVNAPVADSEFLAWKYPPYCELCNVYFNSESNSKIHFDGRNHRNRLQTWRKYQKSDEVAPASSVKSVLCDVCWKEMNTQLILDAHRQSPAHKKEESGRSVVQKLKEEYRQLREEQTNGV